MDKSTRKEFRPTNDSGYSISDKDRQTIQSRKKQTTDRDGVIKGFLDNKPSKTSNESLSTDGNKLYSYSTVIATKQKDGTVVVNNTKYSSTTSAQQSKLIRELDSRNIKYDVTGGKDRGYEGEDFSEEIKDEQKGSKHYEKLSKENPEHKSEFKSMSKDEKRHEKTLKSMDD